MGVFSQLLDAEPARPPDESPVRRRASRRPSFLAGEDYPDLAPEPPLDVSHGRVSRFGAAGDARRSATL